MKKIIDIIKNIIFPIIFLIWFIASIVGMFLLSENNPHYMVMLFGQYFFVFGMFPLFSKSEDISDKLISIPFILVGLGCIIIPYLMINPRLLEVEIVWDSVILLLLILLFVIAGFFMIVFPIFKRKKLEKLCTLTVPAKIVRHEYQYSDNGNKLYCPIYEFEFNKNKYEVSNNIYSNIGLKPVGSIHNIKINPDDPYQFLCNASMYNFSIIMGILFLVVSIPIFLYVLYTYNFIK